MGLQAHVVLVPAHGVVEGHLLLVIGRRWVHAGLGQRLCAMRKLRRGTWGGEVGGGLPIFGQISSASASCDVAGDSHRFGPIA